MPNLKRKCTKHTNHKAPSCYIYHIHHPNEWCGQNSLTTIQMKRQDVIKNVTDYCYKEANSIKLNTHRNYHMNSLLILFLSMRQYFLLIHWSILFFTDIEIICVSWSWQITREWERTTERERIANKIQVVACRFVYLL